MNALPLVMGLIFILTIMTVEKYEKFQNNYIVQHAYQIYIDKKDRAVINRRQELLRDSKTEETNSQRQLSFRSFVVKGTDRESEMYKQNRQIIVDLIKGLYGHTTFYLELEQKRPQFVEEILDGLMTATSSLSEQGKMKRIEDISRIQLIDPELQEAYYKMLKGTMTRRELIENPLLRANPKSYRSLLDFIHFNNFRDIKVHLASRELLKAIFEEDELVEKIIQKRKELAKVRNSDFAQFQEFKGKQRVGISDAMLNFDIKYNPDIDKFD